MANSDSEEEILVFAEFEDSVDIEKFQNIHILGASEKNPIIQMDETFFVGKYENALGTYMFFEEDPTQQSTDPLFDKLPDKNLKYLFKTRKYLKMEHAYVTPKEGTELDLQRQVQEPEENITPVTFQTLQEAIVKFRTEWNPNITSELDITVLNNTDIEPSNVSNASESNVMDCD